jgi:hypothetical protein
LKSVQRAEHCAAIFFNAEDAVVSQRTQRGQRARQERDYPSMKNLAREGARKSCATADLTLKARRSALRPLRILCDHCVKNG